jgi:hypothetical protein
MKTVQTPWKEPRKKQSGKTIVTVIPSGILVHESTPGQV